MRSPFFLIGLIVLILGCVDRPEVPLRTYGTILEALPVLEATESPFPFPMEGDNDHLNCVFKEEDFM